MFHQFCVYALHRNSLDAVHAAVLSLYQLSNTNPKIYRVTRSIAWTSTPDFITHHDSTDVLSKTSALMLPPPRPVDHSIEFPTFPPRARGTKTRSERPYTLASASSDTARTPAPPLTIRDKAFLRA